MDASQSLPTNPTALPRTPMHNKALIAGYKHTSAHPGFKGVAAGIAKKEGVSRERAGAILASAARNASGAAHKANPRLARVKG